MPSVGHLLAWDAGTGSCRCLIVDGSGRRLALTRGQVLPLAMDDIPGSLEFDPQQMWETFARLTQDALESLPKESVLALSVTSFRDGMVFLDAEGEVLYAGTNRDARAVAQGFEMAQRHGEDIYRITGRWPLGTDGAAHLLWMRRSRPGIYERITKVLMVADWLTYRLCGEYCSEPTNASSSLLFDFRERRWSAEVAALLDLDPDLFPPVVSPGSVVGRLGQEVAGQLGLPPGTPVVVGLGDSQAACLACGAINDGDTVAVAGTTMPLQMTVEEPLMDRAHRTWTGAHALDGLWSLESSVGLAGITYDWLWEAFGGGESSDQRFSVLSAEAESEPAGSAMALMGPWIADHGRLQFPSRVGFLAPFPMTLDPPLTRPKMARAVLENIAFALKGNLSQLEQISGRRVESLAICGGLSRSSVFNQIVSDVCEIPVRLPAVHESSAVGAAMCAAVGTGIYADLRGAVRGMSRCGEFLEPQRTLRSTYRTLYKRWLKQYQTLLGR
jgi:sugar (pentulose or hexulose) kinase